MRPLQHELTLRCPQHQTIRVVEAFYGWWKDNRDQGCRFHAEDCKETSDAAAFCNGLTECEVPIERSSTSDTCGGFHLFSLQVRRDDDDRDDNYDDDDDNDENNDDDNDDGEQ